jgi:hypothetical protein
LIADRGSISRQKITSCRHRLSNCGVISRTNQSQRLWQCCADGEVYAVPRGSPLKAEANIVYSRFGLLGAPAPSFGDQLKFFFDGAGFET